MNIRIFLVIAMAMTAMTTSAQQMMSDNYGIAWSVVDEGGGLSMSASYSLESSIAQPSPLGASASVNYAIEPGFFAAPDTDTDTVRDFMDNCTLDINPGQLDSNGDGFGNLCDPDLDNSGAVNFADYAQMTAAFLTTPASPNWNPDADLNGDGLVNFVDLALFPFFFLQPPGPSGLAP